MVHKNARDRQCFFCPPATWDSLTTGRGLRGRYRPGRQGVRGGVADHGGPGAPSTGDQSTRHVGSSRRTLRPLPCRCETQHPPGPPDGECGSAAGSFDHAPRIRARRRKRREMQAALEDDPGDGTEGIHGPADPKQECMHRDTGASDSRCCCRLRLFAPRRRQRHCATATSSFTPSRSAQSAAIQRATHSPYSHVGECASRRQRSRHRHVRYTPSRLAHGGAR